MSIRQEVVKLKEKVSWIEVCHCDRLYVRWLCVEQRETREGRKSYESTNNNDLSLIRSKNVMMRFCGVILWASQVPCSRTVLTRKSWQHTQKVYSYIYQSVGHMSYVVQDVLGMNTVSSSRRNSSIRRHYWHQVLLNLRYRFKSGWRWWVTIGCCWSTAIWVELVESEQNCEVWSIRVHKEEVLHDFETERVSWTIRMILSGRCPVHFFCPLAVKKLQYQHLNFRFQRFHRFYST